MPTTTTINQWQTTYNAEYAKWVGLGLAHPTAHKRALKAAKKFHPAHIAALNRRANHAAIRTARHAAIDGATWAMLNGVQS